MEVMISFLKNSMQNIIVISHLIMNNWLSYRVPVKEVTAKHFKYFSNRNFLSKSLKVTHEVLFPHSPTCHYKQFFLSCCPCIIFFKVLHCNLYFDSWLLFCIFLIFHVPPSLCTVTLPLGLYLL